MNTALWTELINSDQHDHVGTGRREDSLDDPGWLERYLKRWGWDSPHLRREKLVPELRRLRRILRKNAEAIALGRSLQAGSLEELNVYLRNSPLVRRLSFGKGRAEVTLKPVGWTVSAVLSEIVSSFAETLAEGEVSRIKICGNKDCRWIFYDISKNKSRKWCELTCSNLMKVRRFRSRRRMTGSAP